MTWIRIDDTFFTHPKTLDLLATAGPDGVAFHLAGLCWCSHRLTDGRVPDSALHLISSQSQTPPSVVEALEETGHWTRNIDGQSWQIANYLEWQESRADIEVKRERDREKKRRQRQSPAVSPGDSPEDADGTPAVIEDRGQSPELTPAVPADDRFEDFWERYPRRDGKRVGKAEAHTAWKRMSKPERDAAMYAIEHYAASGWRPKDACRWLSKKLWREWMEPATPDAEPNRPKEQAIY